MEPGTKKNWINIIEILTKNVEGATEIPKGIYAYSLKNL